ncbi:MAG: hypothetical protein ACRD6U_10760, partial [Nitrososphaeraceae archaeon]
DTKNSIIPASFSVFVPHQAPPSMLNPFPLPPDGKYSLGIIVSNYTCNSNSDCSSHIIDSCD